ncbi:MAG: STAS domain-containing protein [Candidatus Doudnabacteria bacterium]
MSLKITRRYLGDVILLDCVGRATLGEGAACIRDTVRNVADEGWKKILINLAEVSYIDAAGIGELSDAFTYASDRDGMVKLLALTKRVQDLLQITKLYSIFDVYNDEAEAVRSFE